MFSQIVRFAIQSAFPETSRFYVDDHDDYDEDEDVLFCKNNISVHPAKGKDSKTAGYLTIKSRTRKSGHVRLIVTWTPNTYLTLTTNDSKTSLISDTTRKSKLLISDPNKYESLEYFCVDLSEMKVLKLFYNEDDPTCGQFVIGNYENHYKVFNFNCGGLNRVTQVLEDWDWCVGQRNSLEEVRKRCFVVISRVPVLEDCYAEEGRYDPMSLETWKSFQNQAGQVDDVANFRRAVFFGGLSPEVRKEAWKFLLSYHSFISTRKERAILREGKERIYKEVHNTRMSMSDEEYVQFWKVVQCTVDKDVPRTDRSHPYYAGEGNPNIEVMRSILLNYAIYNPHVGYNQGMSDLLAPVLAAVQDEVDAFWCFVGLMEASVFVTSPKDDVMDKQLAYLRELVRMLEPKFYAHLLVEDDGLDMLFVHRWLLLCFKREFYDEQVLLMWEACWSRYQTDYFHIFLCVAMLQEYGQEVLHRDMKTDEMLHYFTDLSMKMDGNKILRIARQLLLRFRKLPFIPCTLRGLLSGPGIWDSAPLPVIECHCHGNCYYGDRNDLSNQSLYDGSESSVAEDASNGDNCDYRERGDGEAENSYGEKYEVEIPEKTETCKHSAVAMETEVRKSPELAVEVSEKESEKHTIAREEKPALDSDAASTGAAIEGQSIKEEKNSLTSEKEPIKSSEHRIEETNENVKNSNFPDACTKKAVETDFFDEPANENNGEDEHTKNAIQYSEQSSTTRENKQETQVETADSEESQSTTNLVNHEHNEDSVSDTIESPGIKEAACDVLPCESTEEVNQEAKIESPIKIDPKEPQSTSDFETRVHNEDSISDTIDSPGMKKAACDELPCESTDKNNKEAESESTIKVDPDESQSTLNFENRAHKEDFISDTIESPGIKEAACDVMSCESTHEVNQKGGTENSAEVDISGKAGEVSLGDERLNEDNSIEAEVGKHSFEQ